MKPREPLPCHANARYNGDTRNVLKAYLHNKLSRELVRSEDVLTSCVFGGLEAAGEAGTEVATRFLALARLQRAPQTHRELRVRKIEYEFWPWLASPLASAEPDVLLTLEHEDGSRSLVGIEAKLYSGKSSQPSEGEHVGDQLAREWVALRHTAKDRGIPQCSLIYVTADLAPPPDLADSRRELEKKHPDLARDADITWLSWRDLPELIRPDHGVGLADMSAFLTREHLAYFAGFAAPPHLPSPWHFEVEQSAPQSSTWKWPDAMSLPVAFLFTVATRRDYDWPTAPDLVKSWRFQP